jgi:tetratricopeptide (TPR) repeat protein
MAAEAWRDGRRFGIIPVRLPEAPAWKRLDLPPFLRLYTSVDFPSLSDEAALNRVIAGVTQEAPPPDEPDSTRPPYIGMREFTEADSSIFTGRTNYIIDIGEYVYNARCPRFLAVLGASGSGKSSLVHAGVLPRLRRGVIRPETKDWLYVTLRPGNDALGNLRASLAGNPELRPLIDYAASAPEKWLHELASAALGNLRGGRRLVVVVDQFEELLTSVREVGSSATEEGRKTHVKERWQIFAQNLAYAAREASGPVTVLIVMRADFLGYFSNDPDLGPLLGDFQLRCLVQPLSEAEVRAAIERPAVSYGLRFDSALVEAVTQEYLLDPAGALPFLQEALRRVWEKGERRELSLNNYREFGGLRGAVNEHARSIINAFERNSPSDTKAIPQLFVYLTRLSDDGGPDTKRRVLLEELPGGKSAQILARELAKEENRLLVVDDRSAQLTQVRDRGGNSIQSSSAQSQQNGSDIGSSLSATVEIAHECLLVGWSDLKKWLTEKRPERLRLRRLESMARAWQQEDKDARPGLIRGRELRRSKRLLSEFRGETPPLLQNYFSKSIGAAKARAVLYSFLCAGLLAALFAGGYLTLPWVKQALEEKRVQELRDQLNSVVAAKRFDAVSAGELSRRILELRPSDPDAWSVRAQALFEQNGPRFDEALIAWEKNVKPRSPKIDDLLGDRSAKLGLKKDAINYWSKYLANASLPDDARKAGLEKLSKMYAEVGYWQEVVTSLRQLIRLDNGLEPRVRLALAYRELRRWDEMDQEIAWAKANYPLAVETQRLAELKHSKEEKAETEAIAKDPRNATARFNRARTRFQDGLFKESLEDIKKARVLAPDSQGFKIEEAHLHWLLGEEIPLELREVSVSSEWTRDPVRITAILDSEESRLAKVRAADLLIEEEPDDSHLYVIRGKLLANLGQHGLAVEDFDMALELDPESLEAQQGKAASTQALSRSGK